MPLESLHNGHLSFADGHMRASVPWMGSRSPKGDYKNRQCDACKYKGWILLETCIGYFAERMDGTGRVRLARLSVGVKEALEIFRAYVDGKEISGGEKAGE